MCLKVKTQPMLLLIVNKCLFSIKYLDHMVQVSLDVRLRSDAPIPLQCKIGTIN